MNKLERISAVGGFIIGFSLLVVGLYKDNKNEYTKDILIKGAGLISLAVGSGLVLREMAENTDRGYIEENKSDDIYPR